MGDSRESTIEIHLFHPHPHLRLNWHSFYPEVDTNCQLAVLRFCRIARPVVDYNNDKNTAISADKNAIILCRKFDLTWLESMVNGRCRGFTGGPLGGWHVQGRAAGWLQWPADPWPNGWSMLARRRRRRANIDHTFAHSLEFTLIWPLMDLPPCEG